MTDKWTEQGNASKNAVYSFKADNDRGWENLQFFLTNDSCGAGIRQQR